MACKPRSLETGRGESFLGSLQRRARPLTEIRVGNAEESLPQAQVLFACRRDLVTDRTRDVMRSGGLITVRIPVLEHLVRQAKKLVRLGGRGRWWSRYLLTALDVILSTIYTKVALY
jgi:hypothetical protein